MESKTNTDMGHGQKNDFESDFLAQMEAIEKLIMKRFYNLIDLGVVDGELKSFKSFKTGFLQGIHYEKDRILERLEKLGEGFQVKENYKK